jgi:hypothetical protein
MFGADPQIFDLCQLGIATGFFATISYRLEPNGPASRFPVVINRLKAGRMAPTYASRALEELAEIDNGLASLAPDQVIWGGGVLCNWDDRQLPVNHSARNLREYFIADDGRPLGDALREVVLFAQRTNQLVGLRNLEAQQIHRSAWLFLIGGSLWTVLGFVFFRRWVITSMFDDAKNLSGPLIWPAGILLFATGLVRFQMARYPALRRRLRKGSNLQILLTVAVLGLYTWLSWA